MTLDFDTCYRAVLARDARFDGRFFTGVTSTRIYCRPVCPARTPVRRNVRFFPHPAAAEAAGFRACRRCRPEASPGSPDWNVRADLTARAVRLISDGYADEHGISGLASRLAVTDRHLRRLLLAELGATPLTLARTARVQTACRLLAETAMPVSDIAFASGFASIRQFNASFQQAYGCPPSSLRRCRPGRRASGPAADGTRLAGRDGAAGSRGAADPPGTSLTLRLACREPFDGRSLLRFLAARAVPGVELVSADRYQRTIRAPGGPGMIELILPPAASGTDSAGTDSGDRPARCQVLLRIRLTGLRGVGQVVSRCRHLFDLDADPDAITAVLGADTTLAPLVGARPGLRVPGAYDGFELAVRAVLGQQVSVAAARTFAARLAGRFGTPVSPGPSATGPPPGGTGVAPGGAAGSPSGPDARPAAVLFPGPADLAEADLSGLGLTASRQATLRALASAAATGTVSLGPGADPEETAARLGELPGIGPWTVGYVLMRAVRDPDAFPATDLGLRRALEHLGCPPGQDRRWRPWRAYAAIHLWSWLAGIPTTAGTPRAR